MIDRAAWQSLRALGKVAVARDFDLTVEHLQNLPASGPVILAARHFHHLYDGCAIFATVPRQVQAMVGLDWIERPMALKGMQAACRAAGWPVVFRNTDAVERAVWLPMLRKALAESQLILRRGNVLLVFPEGYPTIDPHGSPKTSDSEILPFHPGFARIAVEARRAGIPAPIVPLGFHYERGDRWSVAMRFGTPIEPSASISIEELTRLTEQQVIELSR